MFQMPSSPWRPWPPTVGAPPPRAAPGTAFTSPWERQPSKGFRSLPSQEAGSATAAAAPEAMPQLPSEDYHSEAETQEHEKKANRYQAVLAARLKAKYFSSKAFQKGDVFEEIVIQSETIQLSRWPFTRLFADPAKVCQEKSYAEKGISPSLAVPTSHRLQCQLFQCICNIDGKLQCAVSKCPWNHDEQMDQHT